MAIPSSGLSPLALRWHAKVVVRFLARSDVLGEISTWMRAAAVGEQSQHLIVARFGTIAEMLRDRGGQGGGAESLWLQRFRIMVSEIFTDRINTVH